MPLQRGDRCIQAHYRNCSQELCVALEFTGLICEEASR